MKFTLKNADKFSWDGLTGYAYNSAKDFSNASAAYFEVTKSHGKIKTEVSDRIYYVIDGQGIFIINNNIYHVKKSDVVIIPKNTPYDYKSEEGTVLKLFLVHTPAYNEDKEVKLS